jgi:hypothetical protein
VKCKSVIWPSSATPVYPFPNPARPPRLPTPARPGIDSAERRTCSGGRPPRHRKRHRAGPFSAPKMSTTPLASTSKDSAASAVPPLPRSSGRASYQILPCRSILHGKIRSTPCQHVHRPGHGDPHTTRVPFALHPSPLLRISKWMI